VIDSDKVKNLQIIFNSGLKINKLAITAYYHLRNISKVHYILSPSDNEKTVNAYFFYIYLTIAVVFLLGFLIALLNTYKDSRKQLNEC